MSRGADASGAAPAVSWCRASGAHDLLLTLHIQPGAKTSALAGVHGDALKIRLAAPPVDGKANEALLRFLATRLDLPRSALSLKSGQTSRRKQVLLSGLPYDAVLRCLGCPELAAGALNPSDAGRKKLATSS